MLVSDSMEIGEVPATNRWGGCNVGPERTMIRQRTWKTKARRLLNAIFQRTNDTRIPERPASTQISHGMNNKRGSGPCSLENTAMYSEAGLPRCGCNRLINTNVWSRKAHVFAK